jgi:hypothetical protein
MKQHENSKETLLSFVGNMYCNIAVTDTSVTIEGKCPNCRKLE